MTEMSSSKYFLVNENQPLSDGYIPRPNKMKVDC